MNVHVCDGRKELQSCTDQEGTSRPIGPATTSLSIRSESRCNVKVRKSVSHEGGEMLRITVDGSEHTLSHALVVDSPFVNCIASGVKPVESRGSFYTQAASQEWCAVVCNSHHPTTKKCIIALVQFAGIIDQTTLRHFYAQEVSS